MINFSNHFLNLEFHRIDLFFLSPIDLCDAIASNYVI